MKFLKPLIPRITNDAKTRAELENLSTDVEIIEYITRYQPFVALADEFEKYYGVGFIDLKTVAIEPKVMGIFDAEVLKGYSVLPYLFDEPDKTYYFALHDFLDEELRQNIMRSCRAAGMKARFSFAPKETIAEKYEQMNAPDSGEGSSQEKTYQRTESRPTEAPRDNADSEFNTQEWVNNAINGGIDLNASDIHIERMERQLQVRYRVDGRMSRKQIYDFSESNISSIYVRLKIISGMDISEKRKPQDGRIDNYEHKRGLYDLRVSTVTTIHGEKVVMRIADRSSRIPSFEELGFSSSDAAKVRGLLNNKNGILYVAGATGSGKTTTLYAMIDELNDDSVNIYTIENPVERNVANVNQIQIDPLAGITYPTTLRALLRQDPDVIIVGEIRDKETAEVSVQVSLTGHLVLSTIHANSALESINRLMNMGVEPYMIVGSSLGFLSQRLVRKLCPHCKVPHTELDIRQRAWLDRKCDENGYTYETASLYEATGCEHCIDGYKGRVAVVEIVEMSQEIQALILSGTSLHEIKAQALKDGFKPLAVNGIEIAMKGTTTINELMKEIT